ncbi:unnamed protein product [Boreogadus saida]
MDSDTLCTQSSGGWGQNEIVDRQIADGLIGPEVRKDQLLCYYGTQTPDQDGNHRSLADIGKPSSNPTPK